MVEASCNAPLKNIDRLIPCGILHSRVSLERKSFVARELQESKFIISHGKKQNKHTTIAVWSPPQRLRGLDPSSAPARIGVHTTLDKYIPKRARMLKCNEISLSRCRPRSRCIIPKRGGFPNRPKNRKKTSTRQKKNVNNRASCSRAAQSNSSQHDYRSTPAPASKKSTPTRIDSMHGSRFQSPICCFGGGCGWPHLIA